jgi:pyruvate/2-oxoglutarate dehydrogenase complex dihydrolipoamide acyltransferase (E2) component
MEQVAEDAAELRPRREAGADEIVAVDGEIREPVRLHALAAEEAAKPLELREVVERRADLVARSRDWRLRLEDVASGTFTLSNLDMFGVDAFAATVNPPQT